MATASFGELVLKFSADIADILTATQRIQKELDSLVTTATKSIEGLKSEIETVGEAFLIFKGMEWATGIVTGSIAAQVELGHLSEKTGFTIETLSSLSNTAAKLGINLSDSTNLLTKFELNMNAAASGTGKASAAFAALGFSQEQVTAGLRNLGPFFEDVVKRLGAMEGGAIKAGIQMTLMGKGGSVLAPLFREIAENGLAVATVNDQMVHNAMALSEWWNTLKNDGQQLTNQLVSQMTPQLLALGKTMLDVVDAIFKAHGGIKGFVADGTFAQWMYNVGAYIAGVIDRIRTMGNEFEHAGGLLKAIGALFADFAYILLGVDQIMQGQFTAGFDLIKKGIGDISGDWASVKTAWSAPVEVVTESLRNYNSHILNAEAETKKLGTTVGNTATQMDLSKKSIDKAAEAAEKALEAWQKYNAGLAAQDAVIQANIDSLLKYGVQQKKTVEDTVREDLANGSLGKSLALLAATYGYNLEKLKEGVIAKAKQVDIDKLLLASTEDMVKALKAHVDAQAAQLQADADLVKAETDRTAQLGLTKAEIVGLNIAEIEENNTKLRSMEGTEEEIAQNDRRIASLKKVQAQLEKQDSIQLQIKGWQDVMTEAETVFTNILTKGKDTFSQLTDWLKTTLIKELFALVARTWIIPMIAQVGGQGVASAIGQGVTGMFGNAAGSASGSLFSGVGSAVGSAFAGGAAAYTGATGASIGASEAVGISGAGAGLTAGGLEAGGMGALEGGLAAVPVAGWIALAAIVAYEIWSSNQKPSDVQAQFGVSGGTTGFEDNAFTASKYFGNVGFLDAGTKQFSGQAAQAFNKIIANALDAVGSRLSSDQIDSLRTKLQGMTFAGSEGTFSTEDFLNKYGVGVMKQVLTAAFQELDAPLADVFNRFQGTAEEVGAFANSLLAFYDSTKDLPEAVKANLTKAIGTTQESIDNINAIALATGQIFAVDKVDLAKAASDAYAAAGMTQFESLTAQGDALTELIGKTDDSAAAAQLLAKATTDYATAAVNALIAIKQIAASLKALTATTLETIDDSIRTDDQRYANWQSQIAGWEAELRTTTDPARIAELNKNIDDAVTKSWNMYLSQAGDAWKASHNWDQMTPEQQTASWAEFLKSMEGPAEAFKKVITDTDTYVQQKLTDIGTQTEQTAQQHLDAAADKMTKVADDLGTAADKMNTAADTQNTAGNTQLTAAKTPTQVNVHVDVTGTEVGNLSGTGP